MIQRTSQYECQERFPSSSKQQISSTFVKELNILRCSVFLVTSAKSFQSVDTVIPLFNLHFELCRLINVWSYNFWPAKFALCRGNLDTTLTETQNSLWKLIVINDVHYYCMQHYLRYIRGLPINDTPEIFALHDNANITFAQNETFSLLQGILKIQPRSSSGARRSREEVS